MNNSVSLRLCGYLNGFGALGAIAANSNRQEKLFKLAAEAQRRGENIEIAAKTPWRQETLEIAAETQRCVGKLGR